MPAKAKKSTNHFASREALQALQRKQYLKVEYLPIEQWDGMTVGVRQLSVKEKLHELPQSEEEGAQMGVEAIVAILSLCLVDGNGDQLFEEEEGSEFLMAQSDEVLQKLLTAALEINGMSSDALENLRKNSPEGPSESSVSD